MSAKLYLVAGEASGDARGAELMRHLAEALPGVEFHGAGGAAMSGLSKGRILDWSEHAVIGVVDVLRNYGYFRSQMERMVAEVISLRPEAVVFIDYPGFNLRLAARLRRVVPGIRLVYYISPQVWAWNRGRIPKMARMLDLMLCIFPFEKSLYEQSGLRTVYVGHPMADSLPSLRGSLPRDSDLVALLPGSRLREVSKILPLMAAAARLLLSEEPGLRFVCSVARAELKPVAREILEASGLSEERLALDVGTARECMLRASAGLVASGTATLEAAFLELPYALVYKVAWATYLPAKFLIRVPYLGIVNILAGREVVREFIQHQATPERLASEIRRLREDADHRQGVLAGCAEAISALTPGAAENAARAILELLG